MTMSRAELQEAARQAFGEGDLAPDPAASWALIAEMGWLMMAVPEAQGGLGLGREAAGVVHAALGRALVPGPAIAQMLVIEALSAADDFPQRDDLLGRAMAGDVMTTSLSIGPGLDCVPDADRASHILVLSTDRVALVPLAGATVTARTTWDKTRQLFDVAPPSEGITLATGDAAAALGQRLQSQLLFALAADSLGGADAILGRTIDYLKIRHQFGRPLALFQALKHRVADMKTWLAAAEALLWSRAVEPEATLIEIAALKAHATSVYRAIAEDAIQLHGGIGLTTEYYCHLFLKRATLNSALGGDADYWEERSGLQALRSAA
jgi:alkylation response protein AidB-like acyl-CoA dehydrogenase